MRLATLLCLGLVAIGPAHAASVPAPEKGTFHFRPADDQAGAPPRYRLAAGEFPYELIHKCDLPGCEVRVCRLTFPSPLKGPHPENNTVHAEYYRPLGVTGRLPATIILDITGGDQSLSRILSAWLAQRGVAALFVQMSYYGPRRPPGSRLRFLSPDVGKTLANVRQTVLDLRAAAAWLESRSDVDARKLSILGTSLGSFMAALTSEMEPRLARCVVLLGGGGFVEGYYDHPRAAPYRKLYEAIGGTKEALIKWIAPADPLTCAANLKDRRLLILAGDRDDIVPPKMAKALWEASGKQKIIWYPCSHYGAALYLGDALKHIAAHLTAD